MYIHINATIVLGLLVFEIFPSKPTGTSYEHQKIRIYSLDMLKYNISIGLELIQALITEFELFISFLFK